jgi:pyruvate dehydrogenase complex dehydrogenase (E1) component
MNVNDDVDPIETIEWVDALRAVAQPASCATWRTASCWACSASA